MTDPSAVPLADLDDRNVSNAHETSVLVAYGGALEQPDLAGSSVLIYPASVLADGVGGLWLRRRGTAGTSLVSLVGQSTTTTATAVVKIRAE